MANAHPPVTGYRSAPSFRLPTSSLGATFELFPPRSLHLRLQTEMIESNLLFKVAVEEDLAVRNRHHRKRRRGGEEDSLWRE